jgi:ribosomal protein S18 acetylase RimI-like enzyme
MSITFRAITDRDLPFLERVYASTRQDELSVVPWSEQQKSDFLAWQFQAQHTHYMQHYPDADFEIILKKGRPIGRLYQETWSREIRIIDIALLPQYRGNGIGTQILKDIQSRAEAQGLAVSIHVEHNNPALGLYRRLGFVKISEKGVYWLMEWTPGTADSDPVPEQEGQSSS